MANIDIIKTNTVIRNKLLMAFKISGLKNSDIIKDAKELGVTISKSNLSNYLNANSAGLTQRQVLWLAVRYNLTIKVTVKTNNLNKEEILELLDSYFG